MPGAPACWIKRTKNTNMSERKTNPVENEEAPEEMGANEAAVPETAGGGDHLKIAALQEELAKTKDQMLRALADAENSRKRALKEREDTLKYAVAGFAKDLLSVSDNLQRALDSVPADALQAEPRLKGLVDGIAATQRELAKGFEQHGIRIIDPADEPFNPNYHEVMFEVPGTGKPAGRIVQVIEVGYLLHDRLLRPARVGVAKDDGQGNGTPGVNLDTEA